MALAKDLGFSETALVINSDIIDEESATGTSSCALACYLFKYYKQQSQYTFEQRFNIGAVSQLIVDIAHHESIIEAVCVGGYGRLVFRKTLPM